MLLVGFWPGSANTRNRVNPRKSIGAFCTRRLSAFVVIVVVVVAVVVIVVTVVACCY